MTKYKFENLEIWKKAIIHIDAIYKISSNFPKSEQFGLTTQLRRAAVSIALNIAEGSDRNSDADFIRFLRMALGSLNEVVTILYIAKNRGFINQDQFEELYSFSVELTKQIKALIKKLKSDV